LPNRGKKGFRKGIFFQEGGEHKKEKEATGKKKKEKKLPSSLHKRREPMEKRGRKKVEQGGKGRGEA